jgi:hypothetical protein
MQVVGYGVGQGGALVPIMADGSAAAGPFGPQAPMLAPQVHPNAQGVPGWMGNRQAPGVWGNDEDLVPLALVPDTNGGVFTAATPTTINFIGKTQKPFRSERPVATIVPTGASVAGARALAQVFVGTDYQGANIASFDLGIFAATAFGVRLKLKPAEPGVEITFQVTLSTYPTGTDNVFVDITLLGAYYQ